MSERKVKKELEPVIIGFGSVFTSGENKQKYVVIDPEGEGINYFVSSQVVEDSGLGVPGTGDRSYIKSVINKSWTLEQVKEGARKNGWLSTKVEELLHEYSNKPPKTIG